MSGTFTKQQSLIAWKLTVATILFFCLKLNGSVAAPPETSEMPNKERGALETRIEQDILALSDSEFQTRREAFLDLLAIGPDALPQISSAKDLPNRTQSEAAAALELLLQLGIGSEHPDMPADLLEALTHGATISIIDLCQRGQWELALRLIDADRLLTNPMSPEFLYQMDRIVTLAVSQGDCKLAWPIMRAKLPPTYASWIASAAGVEAPTLNEADPEVKAWQLLFAGQPKAALEIPNLNPRTRITLLCRLARWTELISEDSLTAISGSGRSPAHQAVRAVLLEFANEFEQSNFTWEQLLKIEVETNSEHPEESDSIASESAPAKAAVQLVRNMQSDPEVELHARQLMYALLISGSMEAADAIAKERDQPWRRNYFLSRGNYDDVFSQAGLKPDLSNFAPWVDELRPKLTEPTFQFEKYEEATEIASLLISLGQSERAERLLTSLMDIAAEPALSRNANEALEAQLWSGYIIRHLSRAEQRQMLFELVKSRYHRLSRPCQDAILQGIFPEIEESAKALLYSVPRSLAKQAEGLEIGVANWQALEHLYQYDRAWFGENYEAIITEWLSRARDQAVSNRRFAASRILSELSDTAMGFGLVDLATELASGDGYRSAANILDLAQINMKLGRWSSAADYFSILRRSGYRYHSLPQEIESLVLAGRYEEAEVVEESRWLHAMPAYDNSEESMSYFRVGQNALDREDEELACEYFEPAYLLSDPDSYESFIVAYSYSRALDATSRHLEAADLRRSILVDSLRERSRFAETFSMSVRSLGWLMDLVQTERLQRALDEIKNQRFETAMRHLKTAHRVQPFDIESVVQCFPPLVLAGQKDLAQELFDLYDQSMKQHLEKWPADSMSLNNLAWMYAKCDQNLEYAAQLAHRAVAIAPNSATYLDTLAEIQFRRGLVEAAIISMQQCVHIDPRTNHYRKQLARFRQAP
ncbi:MAG: hypothetical protein KDB03_02160 [Planctomycetales bacterium]|nr:hypothetical protein [Planctomycetales bacterium]